MAGTKQNAQTPEDIRQILNRNTQQRKIKRSFDRLLWVLLLLLLLLLIGFLTYFIVYNNIVLPTKEVVVKFNITSYDVQEDVEYYIDSTDFEFTQGEESNTKSDLFEHKLPKTGYIKLQYTITNNSGINYSYNINFNHLTISENCKLTYYTNLDSSEVVEKGGSDLPENKLVKITSDGNVVISVLMKVLDVNREASCVGNIFFTISVA